jgi:hypothetical protein
LLPPCTDTTSNEGPATHEREHKSDDVRHPLLTETHAPAHYER